MWDGMSVCLCFLLGEEGEIVELYLWGDFLFFFLGGLIMEIKMVWHWHEARFLILFFLRKKEGVSRSESG